MHRPLLATFLLLAAPALAGDEPGVWTVKEGTQLKLGWEFTLDEKTHHTDEGDTTRHETRKVTATATCPRGFKGTGYFDLVIDTVEWTVKTEGYTLELKKSAAKAKPQVSEDVKDSESEGSSDQEVVEMREYVQARYRLQVRPGHSSIRVKGHNAWQGGADAPSLFNRCYVQSDLPDEDLKSTKRWIDERESEYLPLYNFPGNMDEIPEVKLRLQLAKSGLSAKGSGAVTFKGITLLNWKYAGKSNIKRSFEYSAAGFLDASSEEAKSQIKRTNKTKPGKSDGTITIKQSLTLEAASSDQ